MNKMKPVLHAERLISDLGAIGDKITDTEQEKIQHHLLVYMGLSMGCGGLLWGSISTYFQLFLPGSIPFGYSILTIINFALFHITKNFHRARFVQVLISLLLPFMFQWSLGGFVSSGAMMLWSMVALVGSITVYETKWGIRWVGIYLLLTIFSGFVDGYVSTTFGLNLPPSTTTVFFVLNITVISVIVFGLGLYLLDLLRSNQGNTEKLVVERTNELNDLLGVLEQRVADRTKALTTSAEVFRSLAAVTNPRQLAIEVVKQLQSAFDYYHAHMYFVDEATGDLVMAGGTGEVGAALLARSHKIPKGRGLVGRAADTNAAVLVPDVSQAEGWLPNPLLPETRSEAAVPISLGNRVLGVLDVQENSVNGLDEEDVNLLQSLASQVAISLQNARILEESRSKSELESMVNLIGQKIQRTTSIEETLQTAIRELGTAIGASSVKAKISSKADENVNKN